MVLCISIYYLSRGLDALAQTTKYNRPGQDQTENQLPTELISTFVQTVAAIQDNTAMGNGEWSLGRNLI